jgi:hypothetical protein
LRRVSDGIERLPRVREAESLTNVIAFWWDPEQEWAEVPPFIQGIPSSAEELETLRGRAMRDPVYRKALISDTGLTAAINVSFQPMSDDEFIELKLDERILAILEAERGTGIDFFVTGRPHIRAQGHHLMVGDLVLLIPIAVGVAAILLTIMTGSIRATLIPLTAEVTAMIWSFSAMAIVGKEMNLITIVLGPMLICVASVYGIHILGRYDLIAHGARPSTAVFETLRYARTPVLIAGATTMIGFGALLLADVRATNELGAFAVFGIGAITLLSLTGVPAALALLPLERHEVETTEDGEPLFDFLSFFLPSSRVRTDFGEVNRRLTGSVPVYVSFFSAEEGTFRTPEKLVELERVQEEIQALPGVNEVLAATDLVRIAHRALSGKSDGEPTELPGNRPATAEAVFTVPKAKMRRFHTSNHSSANLLVRTDRLGSREVRGLEREIEGTLRGLRRLPTEEVAVTGNAVLINRSADGIAGNQVSQVGFATAAILLLMWLVFRSSRIAFLSIAPNIVPVLLFFGLLGTGLARLSLATGLIGCVALGIAVDDTVHFLVSYQHARQGGTTPRETDYVIRTVGRPIVLTSIMLMVGFLVMLASNFPTLREFGYLTAATMGICPFNDLLLLPSLLVRLRA